MIRQVRYVCEICGKSSRDKAVIEACERLGRKNNDFSKGQRVLVDVDKLGFIYPSEEGDDVKRGRIKKVRFAKGTHQVSYDISLDTQRCLWGIPPAYLEPSS